ncbi:MAG TPA: hypothetical protein DIT04_11060 [Dysgonomonas sp.]|nr:hypothetical protein [Dysgonomonas sp.]
MKKIHTYFKVICLVMIVLAGASCSQDDYDEIGRQEEGTLLKMSVSFGPQLRLAELPDGNAMAEDNIGGIDYGLKNVGLYVYYTDDYNRGDLSKPYIRNQECTVLNDELQVVIGPNDNPLDKNIFIYDRMTIVAFYPYNSTMSDPANYFTTKADEEMYPITRNDYSQQYYIPYRAQVETNPAIAYYTQLSFYPKHTYKVEVVVVSDDEGAFPTGDIKILPAKDSLNNPDIINDGRRAVWFDRLVNKPNGGGGSNVQQYIAYFWTHEGNRNEIQKGDILLQSDNLTLIASRDVSVVEQQVYRYGYNLSNGEIFIPTSSNLINDAPSLQALNGSVGDSYQVCDIDLTSQSPWTPINMAGGRFDGGGHRITGLNVNTTENVAGLFGTVQGNSTVCNVNLINPQITVNNTTDDKVYAGGLAGRLNTVLSDEEKNRLIANLPPNLSPVVREAIIRELLANISSSESNTVGSRVENPTIVVNGNNPDVGSIVGAAGDKDDEGTYKSRIWDTYALGGSITVNAGNTANNTNANVGGFVGLNNGYITRSYTTTDQINVQAPGGSGQPDVDKYTGFANMGNLFTPAEGGDIIDSFSSLADGNGGVRQFADAWPSGWVTYQGIWPVYTIGWLSNPANSFWYDTGGAPGNYPVLQWQRR